MLQIRQPALFKIFIISNILVTGQFSEDLGWHFAQIADEEISSN